MVGGVSHSDAGLLNITACRVTVVWRACLFLRGTKFGVSRSGNLEGKLFVLYLVRLPGY